jgi:hypothetical protein
MIPGANLKIARFTAHLIAWGVFRIKIILIGRVF